MTRVQKIELAVVMIAGMAIGLGGYTFVYAKGYSYLLNDPAACANCHVMREQLDGWAKSSHRAVAVCNDCHTPHNFIGKYATKATNGFFHSLAFTTGRFPDAIDIKERNRRVTESACRYCHQDIVTAMDGPHQQQKISCLRCHASVGHMH
jgi:cytochrome c nitrite reductase small subunit